MGRQCLVLTILVCKAILYLLLLLGFLSQDEGAMTCIIGPARGKKLQPLM